MSSEHGLDLTISLELQTVTTTGNITGVDCTALDGTVVAVFNMAAGGAGAYNVPKLQYSTAQGGTYYDIPGATVTQAANTAYCGSLQFDINGYEKWIRVVNTVTGTYSAVTSVTLTGRTK